MKENKELDAHVEAIGKWASESKKRVAFVVCGEITEDDILTTNSIVGRIDRIAYALCSNAQRHNGFKCVTTLASDAIKNPTTGKVLGLAAAKDKDCDDRK